MLFFLISFCSSHNTNLHLKDRQFYLLIRYPKTAGAAFAAGNTVQSLPLRLQPEWQALPAD